MELLFAACMWLAHIVLPATLATPPTDGVTPLSVTVQPTPRQTFAGFGWSLVRGGGSPFHGPLGNFSQPVREHLLTLLCEELGTSVVRLWWTPRENVPTRPGLDGDAEFFRAYVESGLVADLRRHGVKMLLLAPDSPCATDAQNSTAGGHSIALRAQQTASFIHKLRAAGVVIDVTGVANEPGCWTKWQNSSGDTLSADWPTVPDQSGNFVSAVTLLSNALHSTGLESEVKIIGPESSNADSHGLAQVQACSAEKKCWASLDSIASHSYSMAATEAWANATQGWQKGYWMTEAGAWGTGTAPMVFPGNNGKWQGVALACRFLNDMNHGVDTWVWFIGAWIFDTQMLGGKSDCAACGALCGKITCGLDRQEDMKLISTCPQAEVKPCYSNASGDGQSSEFYQLMPQYHYAKQLRQTFDLGCVMRQSTVNTTHTVGSRTYPFLPQMTWTYGAKNSLNVAVGLNPDNTWGVAVANPTGIPTVQSLNGVPTQLFSNATTLEVELSLDEWANDPTISFVGNSSTGNTAVGVPVPAVKLQEGKVRVVVAPNELLTLRSLPMRTVQDNSHGERKY